MPKEPANNIMSLRLPDETAERLDKLAEVTGRSKSYLAAEAIREFCDLQEWQLGAIIEGIEAADKGRTVPHEAVKSRWKAKKGASKRA